MSSSLDPKLVRRAAFAQVLLELSKDARDSELEDDVHMLVASVAAMIILKKETEARKRLNISGTTMIEALATQLMTVKQLSEAAEKAKEEAVELPQDDPFAKVLNEHLRGGPIN